MYLFIKFVHIISAMVFFGLPFAFGRWFHSSVLSESTQALDDAAQHMQKFVRVHLNLCAVILIGTGIWLARHYPQWPLWIWLALIFLVLGLINLHLHLGRALSNYRKLLSKEMPKPEDTRKMRIHFAVFTAIHHTLVTASAALMVFRWTLG